MDVKHLSLSLSPVHSHVSVGGASLRLTLTTDGQPTRVPAGFQVLPAESPLLGYNPGKPAVWLTHQSRESGPTAWEAAAHSFPQGTAVEQPRLCGMW